MLINAPWPRGFRGHGGSASEDAAQRRGQRRLSGARALVEQQDVERGGGVVVQGGRQLGTNSGHAWGAVVLQLANWWRVHKWGAGGAKEAELGWLWGRGRGGVLERDPC